MSASTSKAWDDAAHGWNRHSDLIRAWLKDATAAMLDAAGLMPGDRVLDVAAGAGDQTLDVARRVGLDGSVLAIDLSPGILSLAEDKLRAAGLLHQVQLRLADAQALGSDVVGFDAAVCRLGLMFCPEPLLALKEIHRALLDGGHFAALVFLQPRSNPCIAISMRTAQRHAGAAPRDPFSPGSLLSLGKPGLMSSLMHDAGFGHIEVRALPAPFAVPSCEDYVDFVRGAGSPVIELLRSLPAAAREAAWTEMAQELAQFTTPNGWVGPNELLLCAGVKSGRA